MEDKKLVDSNYNELYENIKDIEKVDIKFYNSIILLHY